MIGEKNNELPIFPIIYVYYKFSPLRNVHVSFFSYYMFKVSITKLNNPVVNYVISYSLSWTNQKSMTL